MPSLRKIPRSPFYFACFRDNEGRQFNRSTKQKNHAKALAVALEFERLARGWIDNNPTIRAVHKLAGDLAERIGQPLDSPTIRAEITRFAEGLGSKSARTGEKYKQIVRQFLEHLGRRADDRLHTLTARDVETFRDARLKTGVAPQTVAYELKRIRGILARAMRAGRVEKNVAADVNLPEGFAAVREVFEPEHLRALLLACERHVRGKDWQALILTAFYTGARLSDVANLKWSNLDFSKRALRFIPSKTKRRAGEIQIPLHPELETLFMGMTAPDRAPDAPLFPTLAGRGTGGAHGLSAEFASLLADAGIERRAIRTATGRGRTVNALGFHSLRHSFATHLGRAGVTEDLRMRLCGHETKAVSRAYTHTEIDQLRAAVALLPGIGNPPAHRK